jgi:DNA-binding transcriptional regulator YiaG
MPKIADVFREEIQRLARKQVKAALGPLKRDQIRLKKSVAELRRNVEALDGAHRELRKKVTLVVETKEAERATGKAATLRPTSKSLERLRGRLGLTQVQFGRLLGVSGPAVTNWAAKNGRVRMRGTTLAALAAIQNIGKREALRRLSELGEPKPVRKGRRRP